MSLSLTFSLFAINFLRSRPQEGGFGVLCFKEETQHGPPTMVGREGGRGWCGNGG